MQIAYYAGLLLLTYILGGIFFYLFLQSLLRMPAEIFPKLNVGSWHTKMAYPFKCATGNMGGVANNFLAYYTKIYFMLILGWPVLIIWETVKIIVYTPLLFLFFTYPVPSFQAMSDNENPFAVELRMFYVPSFTIYGKRLEVAPIFILLIMSAVYIAYRWPMATLKVTLVVGILTLFAIALFYSRKLSFILRMMAWLRRNLSKAGGYLATKINKLNFYIKID